MGDNIGYMKKIPQEPIIHSNCNPDQKNESMYWGIIFVKKKMPHPRLAIIKSIYNADQNNESKLWGIIFVR